MHHNFPKGRLLRTLNSNTLRSAFVCAATLLMSSVHAEAARTMADVLATSKPTDWRALDPENTVYMDLPSGRVVIELAPQFAPQHAANVRALVREGFFDGL